MLSFLFFLSLFLQIFIVSYSKKEIFSYCPVYNNQTCAGNGQCNNNYCHCKEGFKIPDEFIDKVTIPLRGDCSEHVCPISLAWGNQDVFSDKVFLECSGHGNCDRSVGHCLCQPGFYGIDCSLMKCDCSGHGNCLDMHRLAKKNNLDYNADWSTQKLFGCVCESSWTVGTGINEYPETEFFGANCAYQHCPYDYSERDITISAADCLTLQGVYDGTNCKRECSNRGTCDYKTGRCNCYKGALGPSCKYVY